jgi:hypothetical protein
VYNLKKILTKIENRGIGNLQSAGGKVALWEVEAASMVLLVLEDVQLHLREQAAHQVLRAAPRLSLKKVQLPGVAPLVA